MVNSYFKDLPILDRQPKPRETGINYVRAPVMAGSVVEDYLAAFGEMVDIFKLSGKQAMMMSDDSLKAFISSRSLLILANDLLGTISKRLPS